jgi:hypothetical protein
MGCALVGTQIQYKSRIILVVIVHIVVVWIVTLYGLVCGYQEFGLMSFHHFHG